jgi:hypothetical protein
MWATHYTDGKLRASCEIGVAVFDMRVLWSRRFVPVPLRAVIDKQSMWEWNA